MLASKGHEKIVKLASDPVHVNVVAKKNEDVRGAADNRSRGAGAAIYWVSDELNSGRVHKRNPSCPCVWSS